jgi:hypothetical protein
MHGMSDWFKDHLNEEALNLIGTYDGRKGDYNLTLIRSQGNETLSFNESVTGWTSFKSFVPENGLTVGGNYYTFSGGRIYQHHSELVDRNYFYGVPSFSSLTFLLNTEPGFVKNFKTINYEGSQSAINHNSSDGEYYNLSAREGWFVESLKTNMQSGTVNEFIEKEGKWFNYIKGNVETLNDIDTSQFHTQGIGLLAASSTAPFHVGSASGLVYGCTNPASPNFDPMATVYDGSCGEYDFSTHTGTGEYGE